MVGAAPAAAVSPRGAGEQASTTQNPARRRFMDSTMAKVLVIG